MTVLLLPNLGNTCYANAVFQMLAASPSFSDNLVKEDDEVRIKVTENDESLPKRRKRVAGILLAATRSMLVDRRPKEAKSVLNNFHAMVSRGGFRVHDSNDAQEFLVLFLECLREASTRSFRLLGERIDQRRENPALCKMMDVNWNEEIGASYFSPLACMQGQYLSETRCGACGYTTHAPQVHTVLPIPPRPTVEASVVEFFAAEKVEGWKCDRCGERHPDTRKRLLIWRSSRIVVVHITRFLPDGRKDTTPVKAPSVLQLSPFYASGARPPVRVGYALRAVVDHTGDKRSGGHYTCDVLRRRKKILLESWDRLNDDVEMAGGGVGPQGASATSYMLLYEAQ